MLQFDSLGNLFPYDVIPLNEIQFKEEFILKGNLPEYRLEMWDRYQEYLIILKDLIKSDFHIWLYGSIITLDKFKKTSDIDILVCIPKIVYDLLDKQGALQYYLYESIDLYKVQSQFYWIVEANSDFYEQDWASITRQKKIKFCKTKDGLPRGCVQLNY